MTCGLNGVRREIASPEYDTYIIPMLLHGLGKKEIGQLEAHHRMNLRYMQHLPQSTAIPAIHLLPCIASVEARNDTKTLIFFHDIVAAESNTQHTIYIHDFIIRQLT